MVVSVQSYRKWFRDRVKEPEKRELANAALDAFEQLKDAKSISETQLRPIVEAARCRFHVVFDLGTDLLTRLARKHRAAHDALREMLDSRKVNERFQVVAALNSRVPKSLALEMIRKALQDRGNRVREKAAEAADRLNFKELLPEIEQALAVETHPSARKSLEFHLVMLRDGYRVEHEPDSSPSVVVRTREGYRGRFISQEDLDSGRLMSIITELRENRF